MCLIIGLIIGLIINLIISQISLRSLIISLISLIISTAILAILTHSHTLLSIQNIPDSVRYVMGMATRRVARADPPTPIPDTKVSENTLYTIANLRVREV